ncbi:hypothetical protein D3C84_1240890 [compost metagenome]
MGAGDGQLAIGQFADAGEEAGLWNGQHPEGLAAIVGQLKAAGLVGEDEFTTAQPGAGCEGG